MSKLKYGIEDASFQAAGGVNGIAHLVDDFYRLMDSDPAYLVIREMHSESLEVSRDKLALFLCGWLGGPRLYREKYGPISIPQSHCHLPIGYEEKEAWLSCMQRALELQNYAEDFKDYMIAQLRVPAERILVAARPSVK